MHLRYNLFIVLYPVGVSGELICVFKTWQYFKALSPESPRPFWTYFPLPNKLNISFVFEDVTALVIPLIYTIFFPGLYMHMIAQRSKHYNQRERNMILANLMVPEKFKTYMSIVNLQKLQYPAGKKVNPTILTS